MATLIKFKRPPEKHLEKNALSINKINCVQSLAEITNKKKRLSAIDDQILKARFMINDFRLKRQSINEQSHKRGEERAERQLIIEVLLASAHFLAGLKTEALAIEKLSRRIAENILNKTDFNEDIGDPVSLRTTLRLSITVPEISQIAVKEFLKLREKLQSSIELVVSPLNSPLFAINIAGNSSSFSFNERRLLSILKNANKRLVSTGKLC